MPRSCKNHPDLFCYVCGNFTAKPQRRSITTELKKLYKMYFGCPLGDQDKRWAPHLICSSCASGLRDWLNKRKPAMPFAVPMVWRDPRDHAEDCYFCIVNVRGFTAKRKSKIIYRNLDSARRPVPHDDTMPAPLPPQDGLESVPGDDAECIDEGTSYASTSHSTDSEYEPEENSNPIPLSQARLNDLIREMCLSKQKAELLASRLKENNLLENDVLIGHYRKRNLSLSSAFRVDGPLCFCHNVNELFEKLHVVHRPDEWILFIDSSKRSLKAVLLHNGNQKPSVPIAHSVHLKEKYENIEILLESIQYNTYKWNICGDLKVVGIIMGLQGGFTKHCYFLCLWDSRATSEHYIKRNWPMRTSYNPGSENIQHVPLVDHKKILLPPLHIKLGLMKNFVKAMGKVNSNGYAYLCEKFSKISSAKMKEGIFIGPQIREVMKDPNFEKTLTVKEKRARQSFKWLCENFLGNVRSPSII